MSELTFLTLKVRGYSYTWRAQRACRQHWQLARMEVGARGGLGACLALWRAAHQLGDGDASVPPCF